MTLFESLVLLFIATVIGQFAYFSRRVIHRLDSIDQHLTAHGERISHIEGKIGS